MESLNGSDGPSTPATGQRALVLVIGDDLPLRVSLEALIRAAGWGPETLRCALEFLSRPGHKEAGCLLLDVRAHEPDGLGSQERVAMGGPGIPIIDAEFSTLCERYATLSKREREVMALVAAGRRNKQVAGELGISEITVKAHRGNLMRKMKARSLAELVIMSAQLQQHDPLGTRSLPIRRWPDPAATATTFGWAAAALGQDRLNAGAQSRGPAR